ncbi:MAG: extracellular solute-binding protein [Eubacterium sp.]|nr:extracellular solute-binding protein [Eubacterium sp.]
MPDEAAEDQVTLTLFSNLPDRRNGQGLVEQMIIDEYMNLHPEIKIEVETLNDEDYKTKFRAYAIEGMPDIVSVWGLSAFMLDGIFAELDEEDYRDYGFMSGSLDGFRIDGKLYGLPRNTDVIGFYYNKKLFAEHGWEIPETYGQLLELASHIRAAGFAPVAMDGLDSWPVADFYSNILYKITGGYQEMLSQAIAEADFSDPAFAEGIGLLRQAVDAGLFQDGYDYQDYGMAMNLFTSGQAAMFYMGSWEASMTKNGDIPQEVRDNIGMFLMPRLPGEKAESTGIMAWNGGGYAVSAESRKREEAVRFLNFMYQPDKLSRYGWENSIGMSAQDQSAYITGDETELQLAFVEVLNAAKSMSGTPVNDAGSAAFKACIERYIIEAANSAMEIGDFLKKLEEACR